MSHLPGKFVWFEHLSNDIPRAREFYQSLFGWQVKPVAMGSMQYDMIHNGDDGIGGLFAAPPGVPAHWVSHMSVADVDMAYRAALNAGAKSAMAPQDFPPVGRGAAIVDPTGAAVSLWKSADADRPDAQDTPVGDWVWNELLSSDVRKALAFYEKAFGITHEAMEFGDMPYYMLKTPDGKTRAGAMQAPHAGMPSVWIPYVRVANADETGAKAEKLGGRLLMPVDAVPGVGRLATLADPLGAMIAFIQTEPM